MMKETGHLPKKIHMIIKIYHCSRKIMIYAKNVTSTISLQYNLKDNNHCVCNFE